MSASNNYVLGRGKLYFERFVGDNRTPTRQERYFGNTTELNFSLSTDKLDHYSSEAGTKVKDDSAAIQTDSSGNFICDNINDDNVALFFLGDAATLTVAGATGVTDSIASAVLGSYFQLGQTALVPSGARKISTVVVHVDPDGANTLVAALNNYTVDAEMGRIHILADAVAIDDGDELAITFTQVAHTRSQVLSKSETIYGAMRFIADNPKGTNRDYYLPYVEITPNGDYALKGDTWQQLGFNIEVLKRDDDTERLYIDGRAVT
jgi:hypothetical protein